MKLLGSVFVLCAVWGISETAFFKFEDCTRGQRVVNISQFMINPDPVNMKKNMSVTLDLNLLSDIPEDAVLKTRYYKIKRFFGTDIHVPIPCILGKFGSCNFHLCKYLEIFREQAEPLFPEGVKYGCPLKARTYGGTDKEVVIPDMGAFARLIVSGKYLTQLELEWKGKVLGCYKIHVEMK